MNRTFAVAIVAAVVGAAAAPALGCAGGPHCRDVSIKIGAGAAQIQDILDDTFTQNGVMKWELDAAAVAAGYYFPADGIDFYPTQAKAVPNQAPPNEFTRCKAMPQGSSNPTKFQCDNAHHTIGRCGLHRYCKELG